MESSGPVLNPEELSSRSLGSRIRITDLNGTKWGKILEHWAQCQKCRYIFNRELSLENCPNCYDKKFPLVVVLPFIAGVEADNLQESYLKYLAGNKKEQLSIIKAFVNTANHLSLQFLIKGEFKADDRLVPEKEWLTFTDKINHGAGIYSLRNIYDFYKEVKGDLFNKGNKMLIKEDILEKCFNFLFIFFELLIILNNQYNVTQKNHKVTIII